MTPQAKRDDVYDMLKSVVDAKKVPILDSELRAASGYLVEYYGPELARLIYSLSERAYFPAAIQIEDEIRATLGMPKKDRGGPSSVYRKDPPKGRVPDPSEVERECVVSGQKPDKARAGAELMRKSREAADRRLAEREARAKKIEQGGKVALTDKNYTAAMESAKAAEMAKLLENFDQETQNPLDKLDQF